MVNESDWHPQGFGRIPGLLQWHKDPEWLWLWHRLAATASIQPPAWEPPYAASAALKRQEEEEEEEEEERE